jgi:hypothetical protein
MDLDIKGEIGHMGYVIKLTFSKITLWTTIPNPVDNFFSKFFLWSKSHATRRVWT